MDRAVDRRASIVSVVTLSNACVGLIGGLALVWPGVSLGRAVGVAAACVFVAFVFDRIDGTLARRLGVDSPFGAQLDSLCDVLSFGLLPALILVVPALHGGSNIDVAARVVVATFYLTATVVRLARFTVAAVDAPGATPMPRLVIDGDRHYHGLPSPAAAMVVAAVVLLEVFGETGALWLVDWLPRIDGHAWVSIIMTAAAAIAMGRPWPYPDPPRTFAGRRGARWLLVPLAVVSAVAGPFAAMSVFALAYLPVGLLRARRVNADDGAERDENPTSR